jgi:hypothetical protein
MSGTPAQNALTMLVIMSKLHYLINKDEAKLKEAINIAGGLGYMRDVD